MIATGGRAVPPASAPVVLARLEFALLCALLFVLPIMETPKTVAFLLYVAVWCGRRLATGAWRLRRPDRFEFALIMLVAAAAASTALNWPITNGTKGVADSLRYALVFWCVYRGGYSERQYRVAAAAIAAGALLGIGWGVGELVTGRRPNLELHSAGTVTQSSIYVLIVLVTAIGFAHTRFLPPSLQPAGARGRVFWPVAVALLTLALVVMGSRGALLGLCLLLLFFALVVNTARYWVAALSAIAVVAVLSFASTRIAAQIEFLAGAGQRYSTARMTTADSERYDNWRIALAQLHRLDAPWFGIGPRNYRSIDVTQFSFDPPLRLPAGRLNHAHNLFLTKLVEEGVAGLAALALFLGLVALALARAWARRRWCDWKWFAAAGALAVPVLGGAVNTPFYQEHAILALAVIAVYLGGERGVSAG